VGVALSGEKVLQAAREDVFDALRDPAVLREIVASCRRIDALEADRFACELALTQGPVTGTFRGSVVVDNIDRPWSFSLYGEAHGGDTVGGGRGSAHFAFAAIDETSTNVAYHASFVPTGAMAELPDAVLLEAAHAFADGVFERLPGRLEAGVAQETATRVAAAVPGGGAIGAAPMQRPPAPVTQLRAVTPTPEPAPRRLPTPGPAASPATSLRVDAAPESKSVDAPAPPRPTLAMTGARALGQSQADPELAKWSPPRRKALPPVEPEDKPNPWRWLLTVVGLIIIALLISDGL